MGLGSATMVPELALRLWPSVGAFLAVYKNVHILCPRVNENLSLINIIATWMVWMSSHTQCGPKILSAHWHLDSHRGQMSPGEAAQRQLEQWFESSSWRTESPHVYRG